MEQKEFRSVGKMYKKIAGKRYRLPRKVKKRFKTNMCKHGWDIKKLKFSYKRLNQDVDGKRNVWNKGLTSDTDSRVKQQSITL